MAAKKEEDLDRSRSSISSLSGEDEEDMEGSGSDAGHNRERALRKERAQGVEDESMANPNSILTFRDLMNQQADVVRKEASIREAALQETIRSLNKTIETLSAELADFRAMFKALHAPPTPPEAIGPAAVHLLDLQATPAGNQGLQPPLVPTQPAPEGPTPPPVGPTPPPVGPAPPPEGPPPSPEGSQSPPEGQRPSKLARMDPRLREAGPAQASTASSNAGPSQASDSTSNVSQAIPMDTSTPPPQAEDPDQEWVKVSRRKRIPASAAAAAAGPSTSSTSTSRPGFRTHPPPEPTPPPPPPPKKERIPPIVIRNKARFESITAHLKQLKINYGHAVNTQDGIKIHPQSVDDYRKIQSFLSNAKEEFHSFSLPGSTSCYVVYWSTGHRTSSPRS